MNMMLCDALQERDVHMNRLELPEFQARLTLAHWSQDTYGNASMAMFLHLIPFRHFFSLKGL